MTYLEAVRKLLANDRLLGGASYEIDENLWENKEFILYYLEQASRFDKSRFEKATFIVHCHVSPTLWTDNKKIVLLMIQGYYKHYTDIYMPDKMKSDNDIIIAYLDNHPNLSEAIEYIPKSKLDNSKIRLHLETLGLLANRVYLKFQISSKQKSEPSTN